MGPSELTARLQEEGELLAAAGRVGDLDRAVPTCPEWSLRELLRHVAWVHRWATAIVSGPKASAWEPTDDELIGSWPPDRDLVDWFVAGHATLVATLAGADPGLECWAFLPAPSPLAMWARRQGHETAIHRVDAEVAAGLAQRPCVPPFAADGIDELLMMATRPRTKLRSEEAVRLAIVCADDPAAWTLEIGPEGAQRMDSDHAARCTVEGRADELYRVLWNRADPHGLTVAGDRELLALFLDRVHVLWR